MPQYACSSQQRPCHEPWWLTMANILKVLSCPTANTQLQLHLQVTITRVLLCTNALNQKIPLQVLVEVFSQRSHLIQAELSSSAQYNALEIDEYLSLVQSNLKRKGISSCLFGAPHKVLLKDLGLTATASPLFQGAAGLSHYPCRMLFPLFSLGKYSKTLPFLHTTV